MMSVKENKIEGDEALLTCSIVMKTLYWEK